VVRTRRVACDGSAARWAIRASIWRWARPRPSNAATATAASSGDGSDARGRTAGAGVYEAPAALRLGGDYHRARAEDVRISWLNDPL